MDDADYRQRQVAFVTGLNGTSQLEVLIVSLVGPISILLRNIAIPWLFVGFRFNTGRTFHIWWKFVLDFLLVVFPFTLSLSILADSVKMILLLEMLAILSLSLFSLLEYLFIAREKPPLRQVINQIVDEQHTPTMFITYYRAAVLISTGIAILAVDFPVFPRRFAKTETYGHSVMDVGTACFVFLDGFIRSFRKYFADDNRRQPGISDVGFFRWSRSLSWLMSSSTALLFLLGIGRALLIKAFAYQEHVTEYGLHWNFFITLAAIRIITKLLNRGPEWLYALGFAGIYQYWLTYGGLQSWLLSDASRDNFFSANREGICSLLGYLALYFAASSIGRFVANTGIRLKAWMWCSVRLMVLSALVWLAQLVSELYFGPVSRRIANVPYVLSMVSFNTFNLACFLMVQLASLVGWAARMPHFSPDESPFERVQPCLLEAVNRQGLLFFLAANLGTGIVNALFRTLDMDTTWTTVILMVYAFLLSLLVQIRRGGELEVKRQ